MHGRFHFLHTHKPGRRDKESEPKRSKVWERKTPTFSTLSLSRNLFLGKKKMATKVPIGVGLSLVSLPCASNVRSLVLKSAFFDHGA